MTPAALKAELSALMAKAVMSFPFPGEGPALDMLVEHAARLPIGQQMMARMLFDQGMQEWHQSLMKVATGYGTLGIEFELVPIEQSTFLDKLFSSE